MKEYKIALAGNPNSGKSTIFNELTGARQHVGNYPGVTIEKKEGYFIHQNIKITVVDLPGIYSLTPYSPEEIVARNYIINEKPDLIVDIIDASNLERHLYLATQLMELNVPVLLVFNMIDEAKRKGMIIKTSELSKLIGIPIVETVAHKGKGINALKNKIIDCCISSKVNFNLKINYGNDLENSIKKIIDILDNSPVKSKLNLKWVALKLLENDTEVINEILEYFPKESELFSVINKERKRIESKYNDTIETIIAEKRYGFISGACTETVFSSVEKRHNISDKIDMFLTNRILGIPIFLALMYLVFWLTFNVGAIPMEWIDNFFGFVSDKINSIWHTETVLKSLVIDGIIGGVGSVVIFLPNIIILFLAIGILEYTGYMARAAFVVDKFMHKIGLHGKSFIPMLIGFGCSVPGIMATRTLESKRERILTILVLPLMSCGARLPIYLLIIPAFFPEKFHTPIMWLIYMIGIVLALISARILKNIIFKNETSAFVMELPPYRIPTFKNIALYVWEKSYLYLKKAGTIILAISILLWFLSSFPKTNNYSVNYDKMIKKIEQSIELSNKEKQEKIAEIENLKSSEQIKKSYMGKIGLFLEPIFKPLGFDWKISTAILGALAAKEVFVAQLGIINAVGEADEESASLKEKIKNEYNPLIGFCIMLWALISAPCIATFAITKKETGLWRWAYYQFFGLTGLAYIVTLLVYQIGRIFY